METPPQCRSDAASVRACEANVRQAQEELLHAAPQDKLIYRLEVKARMAELATAQDALAACIAAAPPPPPRLAARFVGQVNVVIHKDAQFFGVIPAVDVDQTFPYSMDLEFSSWRDRFTVTSGTPIATAPQPTPAGDNVTTVTVIAGSGSVDAGAGQMYGTVNFLFDHSLQVAGDSTVAVSLSTLPDAGGSAVDAGGAVVLAGTGTFVGGFLDGGSLTLRAAGTITPSPRA